MSDVCLGFEDTSVVPGQGPRFVVCGGEGVGQQLLHVEGTPTAVSRTEATGIKLLTPSNPTFSLIVGNMKKVLWCSYGGSSRNLKKETPPTAFEQRHKHTV